MFGKQSRKVFWLLLLIGGMMMRFPGMSHLLKQTAQISGGLGMAGTVC